MDLIKQLGPMALGSRLKRLTVRMNQDVSRVYRELGIEFEARWFPVAYLLRQRSPLSIGEIADALNYTHTAIKNFANEMIQRDLVRATQDRTDKRRRILRLSRKGRQVVDQLAPVWRDIRTVSQELIESSTPNLLDSIKGIERQLDSKEMYPRIREKLAPRMLSAIEITEYKPAYRKLFKSLNYEWLRALFTVEPEDKRVLSNPASHILDQGGTVLFAKLNGRIVGTAALIRHPEETFELAKMAVTSIARRRLVGTKLTQAIIERARALGARRLYLETHPELKAAQRLYEKMGFKRIDRSPILPAFRRRRIMMKIEL